MGKPKLKLGLIITLVSFALLLGLGIFFVVEAGKLDKEKDKSKYALYTSIGASFIAIAVIGLIIALFILGAIKFFLTAINAN